MRRLLVAVLAATLPNCMFFRSLDDLSAGRSANSQDGAIDALVSSADGGATLDAAVDAPDALTPETSSIVLGGPSLCDGGALLCDGFEGADLTSGPWYTPATAQVDVARAARGARSMRVHLDAGASSESSHVAAPVAFPKPWQAGFARMFLYVPSGQPVPNTGLLYLYFNGTGYAGADIASTTDGHFLLRAPPNYTGVASSRLIPRDRWVCVEIEVYAVDAGLGALRAWIDLEPLDVTLDGVQTAAIDTADFGVQASTTADFTMWVDEVVVDTKRIGCAD